MPTNYTGPVRHTYNIDGSLADVVATLEAMQAANREAAETTWPCSLSADHEDGVITSATISCTLNITMPVWTGYSSATAEAKAQWDAFQTALEAHEQGHVDIAKTWLDNADQAFVGRSFEERQTYMDDLMNALQSQSDAYDTSTDHGINTGCTITVTEQAEEAEEVESTEPAEP